MKPKIIYFLSRSFNPDTIRICEKHFLATDYERDLMNELLNLPTRKILKPAVYPTQNLLPSMEVLHMVASLEVLFPRIKLVCCLRIIFQKCKYETEQFFETQSL